MPATCSLVGVAQRGERGVAERRQLGAGPDRAEHQARPVRRCSQLVGRPRGRSGRRPRPARRSGRRCRTRRGWPGWRRTCWSRRRRRRPRSRRRGSPRTTSGRVTLRISLQPSRPVEVVERRGRAACSIVPIAPSATTTRSASASQQVGVVRARSLAAVTTHRASRSTAIRRWCATGAHSGPRRPYAGRSDPRRRRTARRADGLPTLRRPGGRRRLRGLERRRRRRHRRGRAPELIWDAEPLAEIDPEDFYDFQVNRPAVIVRSTASPGSIDLADHADVARAARRAPTATSCWSTASSRTCAGGRSAPSCSAIADELSVTPSSSSGALLADTPHTRPIPVTGAAYDPELGAGFGLEPTALRGPDRHRRGVPGRLRRRPGIPARVVLGGGAALRVAAAVPEGDAGAAAPRRGRARHRGAAGDLPEQAEEWERGGQRDGRRGRRGRRVRPVARGARRRRGDMHEALARSTATRSPPSSSATCAAAARGSGVDCSLASRERARNAGPQRRFAQQNARSREVQSGLHRFRGLPLAVERVGLGPVQPQRHQERTLRCGQPVGLLRPGPVTRSAGTA